jgi:Protein of unknown function (DUF1592)/Protein of unknown function (DUF1588)/Protein of unknown function (DUF1587)/Protein of unknown function (DUF1585)/Protein of unknown function (DUF1595)
MDRTPLCLARARACALRFMIVISLLAFAAGCGSADKSLEPGMGGGSGAGNGASAPSESTAALCASMDVARTPLRRLTRFEYANTVRDLLGVDPSPANDLPVDEVTDGFSNNAAVLTVSALHAEKYVLVSEALAKAAVKNLTALTKCDAAAKGEEACALAFARAFGRRAFRRATVAQDEQLLMLAYSAGRTGGSYAEGIEVMIRAALQSPHFLYRLETLTPADANQKRVPVSQFELATRLSYLLWASAPDDALLDAAARGELDSKPKLLAKAREMLKAPKARIAIADFFNQWLGVNRLETISKSSALFPAYSEPLRDAMARELPAFVEYVLWSGDRKFNTLLTAPMAFVSGPLAQLYGVPAQGADGATPRMVMLPANQGRAGILTQAGFAAVQAHPDQTSPVLRGKFIRTKLLCQPPPPPPPDVDITVPDIAEGGTARERFSAHLTAGTSCMGCHQLMDPIGLAFENFDALGQYRESEAGKRIDVSGAINGTSDPSLSGAFSGVAELAKKLANSDQVRDCVATQWFRFASGRGEEGADACSIATLQDAFSASGGDLVELLLGLTQTDAFTYRAQVTP